MDPDKCNFGVQANRLKKPTKNILKGCVNNSFILQCMAISLRVHVGVKVFFAFAFQYSLSSAIQLVHYRVIHDQGHEGKTTQIY